MEASSKVALVQRLRLGKSLGTGAFANVHHATYDGQPVAVKVLLPQRGPSPREDCPVKMFIREGQLLQRVNHSHIARCLAILELPPDFPGLARGYVRPTWALVLELLEGGSLCSLMHKQLLAPWKFLYDNVIALAWSTQIASALAHLHGLSPPVIHRDLKLDNIMLQQRPNWGIGKDVVAKLVDLGLHSRPLTLERNTRRTLLRTALSGGCSSRSLLGTAGARSEWADYCSRRGTGPSGDSGNADGDDGAVVGRTASVPCSRGPRGVSEAFSSTASVRSIFFELNEDGSSLCAVAVRGTGGAGPSAGGADPGGTPSSPSRLWSLCTPPPLPPPQVQVEQHPQMQLEPLPQSLPQPQLQTQTQTQQPLTRVGSLRCISDGTGSFALVLGVPPHQPSRNGLPILPTTAVGSTAAAAAAAAAGALAHHVMGGTSTSCGDTTSGATGLTATTITNTINTCTELQTSESHPCKSEQCTPVVSKLSAASIASADEAIADGRGVCGVRTGGVESCSRAVDAGSSAAEAALDPQEQQELERQPSAAAGGAAGGPGAPRGPGTLKSAGAVQAVVSARRLLYGGVDGGVNDLELKGVATELAVTRAAAALQQAPPRSRSLVASITQDCNISRLATQNSLRACLSTAAAGEAGSQQDGLQCVGSSDLAMEVVYCLTGETGSCMTMAPEIKLMQPYNEKIDVYAFGVVLYEIWSRSMLAVSYIGTKRPDLPYMVHRVTDWPDLVASGFRPARVNAIPGPVWDLISECWDQDPLARPCMAEVEVRLRRMAEEAELAEAVTGLTSGKGGRKLGTGVRTHGMATITKTDKRANAVPSCGCIIS